MLTPAGSASPLGRWAPRVLFHLSLHVLIHHNCLMCRNSSSATQGRDFSSQLYEVVMSTMLFTCLYLQILLLCRVYVHEMRSIFKSSALGVGKLLRSYYLGQGFLFSIISIVVLSLSGKFQTPSFHCLKLRGEQISYSRLLPPWTVPASLLGQPAEQIGLGMYLQCFLH